jgi:hypothetical protein
MQKIGAGQTVSFVPESKFWMVWKFVGCGDEILDLGTL